MPETAAKLALDRRSQGLLDMAHRHLRIWEEFKALEEDEQRALRVLAPRGWLISPSLVAGAPRQILAVIDTEGVDALEQRLIDLFDADRCAAILEKLNDRPAFDRLKPKFVKVIRAYADGDKDVALALLLIASDGIIREELSISDVFTAIARKKTVVRIERELGAERHPGVHGLIKVLKTFGRQRDVTPNPVLRRHAILHGEDPDFGSRRDVIQCILALETLHTYLGLRDGRDETAATSD